MTLVIMAAGMGSRFGGLKQIEPIDEYGNFIIDYSIYDAIKVGFTKVVFVIKKENYEIFRETVGKRVEGHIQVEYAFQEMEDLPMGYNVPEGRVKPWGTGHAIYSARDKVNENFAIINADDFYGRDAFRVIADFLKNNNDNSYALVGYKVKNTLTENGAVKRGVCQVDNGYLSGMTESSIEYVDGKLIASPIDGGDKFTVMEDDIVSMNMFGFTPRIFNHLEDAFPKFLDDNKNDILKCELLIQNVAFDGAKNDDMKIKVLSSDAVWQGVTYREDKDKVVNELRKLVISGEYPEGVWK